MILQVRAHARQIHDRHDPCLLQHFCRTNARALEQCWRADGTSGQYYLARRHDLRRLAFLRDLNARRPSPVHENALRQNAGDDLKVATLAGRREEGVGRRLTRHVHLHGAKALLLITVVVVRHRITRFTSRLDEGVIEGVERAVVTIAYADFAAAPTVLVLTKGRPFQTLVVRQEARVVPTLCTCFFPLVQIPGTAAHKGHAVDARRAAQHLAARTVHHAATQARLRVRPVAPVVLVLCHGDGKRRRHLHKD